MHDEKFQSMTQIIINNNIFKRKMDGLTTRCRGRESSCSDCYRIADWVRANEE